VLRDRTDGRAKGQTDLTKLIVAFRNSAKVPKTKEGGHLSVGGDVNNIKDLTYQATKWCKNRSTIAFRIEGTDV
jgi:hypothetical protein